MLGGGSVHMAGGAAQCVVSIKRLSVVPHVSIRLNEMQAGLFSRYDVCFLDMVQACWITGNPGPRLNGRIYGFEASGNVESISVGVTFLPDAVLQDTIISRSDWFNLGFP